MTRTLCTRAGLALAPFILAACAAAPVAPPSSTDLQRLLAVSRSESYPADDLPDASLFLALSPSMTEFVRLMGPGTGPDQHRLEALFDAFRYHHIIDYQDHATLTAAEAFRQQRANCLSFSAMFVAMARAAGLDARFQEVDVPPTWGSADEQILVQYRHVNVLVRLRRGRDAVIDLRSDRYSENYPRRLLSDREALAHYYSNLSMDQLLADNHAEAQRLAYTALLADDGQSFLWNNMGIIQRRMGRLDLAETSYRQALTLNPLDWSAMSNLAYIFDYQGEALEAARLRALSHHTKLGNPYYRYALAQQAYRRGDFHEVLAQLDEAIASNRREPRFFHLRGMAHWQLGAIQSAMVEMQQALALAPDDSSRLRYQQQLADWQSLSLP